MDRRNHLEIDVAPQIDGPAPIDDSAGGSAGGEVQLQSVRTFDALATSLVQSNGAQGDPTRRAATERAMPPQTPAGGEAPRTFSDLPRGGGGGGGGGGLRKDPSEHGPMRTDTQMRATRVKSALPWHKNTSRRAGPEPVYVCFGLISENTVDLFRTFLTFCYQLFKVVMATLLSLFVPQRCPADPENGFDTDHSCTDKENMGQVSPLTNFETAVLVWNFITLGLFVIHYCIVLKREDFLIDKFDVNEEKAMHDLPRVVEKYPTIKLQLYVWNLIMFVSSAVLIVFFLINAIMSGVMIFRDYYDGFRTVTVFTTNMALMATLLETTTTHAWVGFQKQLGYSCLTFVAASFNDMDPEFLQEHPELKPVETPKQQQDNKQGLPTPQHKNLERK